MERRLLKAIINPAMIATLVLGVLLLWNRDWMPLREGWMHGKLLAVFLLLGVHGILAGHTRRFAEDQRAKTAKFYRILNEVPTALMIIIVLLVVVGVRN
jgi:putative membrane protein